MEVFVLLRGYDYEGQRLLGVFATLESAKSEAEKQIADIGYTPYGWKGDDKHTWNDIAGGDFSIQRVAVVA